MAVAVGMGVGVGKMRMSNDRVGGVGASVRFSSSASTGVAVAMGVGDAAEMISLALPGDGWGSGSLAVTASVGSVTASAPTSPTNAVLAVPMATLRERAPARRRWAVGSGEFMKDASATPSATRGYDFRHRRALASIGPEPSDPDQFVHSFDVRPQFQVRAA